LAALNAAANAATQLNADIEFPTGNYFVSGTWELSGSRCNLVGIGDVTISSNNPQELATLVKPIKVIKDSSGTLIEPKTITVSSTKNFKKDQQIQVVGLDAIHHVIGSSDFYTIDSIDPIAGTLNLKTVVAKDYDPGALILSMSSTSAVIQFKESVLDASIENMRVKGIGPLRFGVQRSGILFKGKGSLRCLNVESCNHPHNGIHIYPVTRTESENDSLGNRHLYFSNCNMHDNGYAGLAAAPSFNIIVGSISKIVAGSVQVVGGIYSNNGPEWSGSSAYGISVTGSKTVVTGAKCENNTGPQIDVHGLNKTTLIVKGCTLAWGKNNDAIIPGGMVDVSGECETLIVEGCEMDGSDAASNQEYGVSIGGFQSYRTGFGSSEQGLNQETIRVVNNVFRNMKFISASAVYIIPWDAKSVEIIGNTFVNCLRSIIVDNQEHPDKFDPLYPTPTKQGTIMGYDKRMIPDIVRIEQNTLIDSGDCYVTCGGLVVYSDNLFTRKYPYKPTDLVSYPGSPFRIGVIVGRVGRVIRRNNKASGLLDVPVNDPPTSVLPKNFHWSVGDQEMNEEPRPGPGSFLGYVCTIEGAAGDTEIKTLGTRDTGTIEIDVLATTHKGTTTIDVSDCTMFCQQQWTTVEGETFSKKKLVDPKRNVVRIVRVIGLGHRVFEPGGNIGKPCGYPGILIVELPADNGVTNAKIAFQKALIQKISIV